MKISVKRTLTLLLAAAIYTSALTGCSNPLSSDQQASSVGNASENGPAAGAESDGSETGAEGDGSEGSAAEGAAAADAAIASGADAAGAGAAGKDADGAGAANKDADGAGSGNNATDADAAGAGTGATGSGTDAAGADTETAPRYDGLPHFEKGMARQMTAYSGPDTPNAESEILRFCVYVETDLDTDGDGMADLVKVFVQVPKSAAQGKYKAAAIYDPTPYPIGIKEKYDGNHPNPYTAAKFDLEKLNTIGKKRESAGRISSYEAAMKANPSEWNYFVPGTSSPGYYDTTGYDYYLVRGFAIVEAGGIGTYGSEGFQLCGTHQERDCHKCVVEWLAGNRSAFTDKENRIEIKADWCNGSVAMTGISYGGTLPFEVATTGVKGLKTIIPIAGISNWYDYRNSQGVSTYALPHYTDFLAGFNAGALYEDDDWLVMNDDYAAWIHQTAADQTAANGNYTKAYAGMDYSNDYKNIECSALIVHGLNDFNVLTKQSDLMYKAFQKAGKNVKILWHQDGHNTLKGTLVGDELFDTLMNKWLTHYLYSVDNGIETMASVRVQSNIDGKYRTYDSWGDEEKIQAADKTKKEGQTAIKSGEFSSFYKDYMKPGLFPERFYLDQDAEHAAVFTLNVPENTTICGVPEVHLKLSTKDVKQDNLMVTALLMDMKEDGGIFKAYLTNKERSNTLPVKTVGTYTPVEGFPDNPVYEYVPSSTNAKMFSIGWADLMDPGTGYIASEDPAHKALKADTFYDYTIYLTPTVYTLQEGHTLKLFILAQDPYRSRLEDTMDDTPDFYEDKVDEVYSFVIDNASVKVSIPTK